MLTHVRVDPRPSDHNVDADNIDMAKLSELEFGTKFQREVGLPFCRYPNFLIQYNAEYAKGSLHANKPRTSAHLAQLAQLDIAVQAGARAAAICRPRPCCKLEENPVGNVEPVQLVVQCLTQATIKLPSAGD